MSLCNIALQVFNDPDVRLFTDIHSIHSCIWSSEEIESLIGRHPATLLANKHVKEILRNQITPNMSQEYKHRFSGDGKHHSLPNKQWEILVDEKFFTLSLPSMFKKEVTTLVRLVLIEYYKWLQDHKTIIESPANFQNYFRWTQDNKIDRHKTVKAIIADDNIDISDRFMLASNYNLQEDVLTILENLDDGEKIRFNYNYEIYLAELWDDWARNGVELDWDAIARRSRFGLQTYFPKLKQEKRLQHLMQYGHRGMWNDYHELQFCLSFLDQNEQNEILTNCPFQVLEVFLDWSVQAKLLDVVELLWSYLSERNLYDFLYLILSRKRMLNGMGCDYVTLVKRLWNRVPSTYKKILEKDTMYNTLQFALEYGGPSPSAYELRRRKWAITPLWGVPHSLRNTGLPDNEKHGKGSMRQNSLGASGLTPNIHDNQGTASENAGVRGSSLQCDTPCKVFHAVM
ncbi:uncharacterized protein TNCV_306761 [Trichonephila clavipes]|nr:uncharacterized protein TNCV_306761 [Trichonephila clavipes]